MEHKTFSVEIKAVDFTGRTVEGYAAAFGNIDQVGDIIHPGAFKQTITDRGNKIKFLWQHDPSEPIGRILSIAEDKNGLQFKAAISDTSRGRDALALLKDGAIGEMSIGYDTVKGGMDYTKSAAGETVRNLRALKLWEISLVTFPANESAVVTGVKQQDVMPTESKPYRNVPDDLMDKMDSCVEQVMEKGQDKETAIAICYTSVVEGKSLSEAYILQGLELPEVKAEPEPVEQKAGRVLSSANVTRIMAAMSALHEALAAAGVTMDDDKEYTEKDNHAIITTPAETASPTPANDGTQPHNSTTPGPDTRKQAKPASVLLREIDVYLAELDTLEV